MQARKKRALSTRDVHLGAYDAGALHSAAIITSTVNALRNPAMDAASTEAALDEQFFNAMCASLLQAGARRVLIPGGHAPAFTKSHFLLERIDTSRHERADKAWLRVVELFKGAIDTLPPSLEKKLPSPTRVQFFVADMVRSFEAGTSMVVAIEPPHSDQDVLWLPIDLRIPIQNILRAMRPTEVPSVVPTIELGRKDLQLLTELFESDLYAAYSSSHELLTTTEVSTSDAVGEIGSRATALARSFGKRLSTSKSLVSLLPSTPKLVEGISGKLTGALATALVGPLTTWLTARSRLVIYRFEPAINVISTAHGFRSKTKTK